MSEDYGLNRCTECGASYAAELAQAEARGVTRAIVAFEDEYCKHDSPLLGVMRGVKAMRSLRVQPIPQAPQGENTSYTYGKYGDADYRAAQQPNDQPTEDGK